jgi:Ca2+-binding RTX toxin-like protein
VSDASVGANGAGATIYIDESFSSVTITANEWFNSNFIDAYQPFFVFPATLTKLTLDVRAPMYFAVGLDGPALYLDFRMVSTGWSLTKFFGVVYLTEFDDSLSIGKGGAVVYAGGGDDVITGSGENVFFGSLISRVYGGDGNDSVTNVAFTALVEGGSGNDVLQGGQLVRGGVGADVIEGGSIAAILEGDEGNDSITGKSFNDTITGGAGDDSINGGDGVDTATYAGNYADYTVTEISYNTFRVHDDTGNDGTDTIVDINKIQFADQTIDVVIRGLAIIGDDTAEVLTGGAEADLLNGSGGDDTLAGLGGNDLVLGGIGNDLIVGGEGTGDDFYYGGDGVDTVRYVSATSQVTVDLSIGSAIGISIGADALFQIENVTGGQTADIIKGNSESNVIDGYTGADSLNGGAGDDTFIVDDVGDVTSELAGEGMDRVESSVNWTLAANVEQLVLTRASALTGTGNSSANTITGNSGANALDGGAGADTLNGGTGDDTYIVDDAGDVLSELIDEGIDRVESSINWTLGANFEQLVLTGTTALTGTGNSNVNTITGSSGANTLDGGTGADTLNGGTGDDTYIVDDVGDVTSEVAGEGTDRVESSINWTLAANVEQLVLLGTSALTGTGNSSANTLTGNSADNSLLGLSGKDTLFGGAGADTLNGGTGADSMAGGAGDDLYFLDAVGDVITESAGEGTDVFRSALTRILPANVEQLVLTGSANVNGTGNADANVITGNTGNNSLSGGAGSDTLFGGQGNDSLLGGVDADSMVGGAGDDNYTVSQGDKTVELAGGGIDTVNSGIAWTLAGNVENLVLTSTAGVAGTGNALANVLRGNNGSNRLLGQDGSDTLAGGAGNDTLTGGAGADVFLFDAVLNASSNRDSVTDFVSGSDKIQLDDDIFSSLTAGVAFTSAQFRSGAGVSTALTSDHRIIYNTTTGELYYDADGAGGVAAVQFAVLGTTTHPTLSSGDFVIVG